MQITKVNNPTFRLEVTEEEARWLKGVMQNPLCGSKLCDESIRDRKARELLFSALAEVIPNG